MSIVDRARALRAVIESLADNHLDDTEALENKELYPMWELDTDYVIGQRRRYTDGELYKCLQNHTSRQDWNPADAISLWARVLIPDPVVIPVWEQPDSTNPYMKGDKVHFPTITDPIYESLIDYNIHSPAVNPSGWKVV